MQSMLSFYSKADVPNQFYIFAFGTLHVCVIKQIPTVNVGSKDELCTEEAK